MKRNRKKWIGIICLVLVAGLGIGYAAGKEAVPGGESERIPPTADREAEGNRAETDQAAAENGDRPAEDISAVVTLAQEQITVDGTGVRVEGNTIRIENAGVYRLTGTLTDGQIYVEVGKGESVVLVLDGVSVTNQESPAIYVERAGYAEIYLTEGTENMVVSGTEREIGPEAADPEASAGAVYLRDDAVIRGDGSLTVYGYINNGIHCSNRLTVESGTITVTAVNHGIKGKDSLTIQGGAFTVLSGGDGLRSDDETGDGYGVIAVNGGSLLIDSGGKGIQAERELVIEGGDITVSQSYEGLESRQITINGGSISLCATDDGINACGDPVPVEDGEEGRPASSDSPAVSLPTLTINGGKLYINAEGDGLDSNGDLTINGGIVIIDGSSSGKDGALDYGKENGGQLMGNGGTVLAIGDSRMAEVFHGDSAQCSFAYTLETGYETGSVITVTAADGTVLCSHVCAKRGDSVVFSDPALAVGDACILTVDDTDYEILLTETTTWAGNGL